MKIYKIVSSLLFIFILSSLLAKNEYALAIPEVQETLMKVSDDSIKIAPYQYDPQKGTIDEESKASLKSKVGVVLRWLRVIASIVSVVALMIIGIKYIIGSVEQKAKYKETLYPYVVGCLIFGLGTNIVTVIYNAFM